jgi:hypothetical protein
MFRQYYSREKGLVILSSHMQRGWSKDRVWSFKSGEIGDNVDIPIPMFDWGRGDPKTSLA